MREIGLLDKILAMMRFLQRQSILICKSIQSLADHERDYYKGKLALSVPS